MNLLIKLVLIGVVVAVGVSSQYFPDDASEINHRFRRFAEFIHSRTKRCTKVECDPIGALSSCQPLSGCKPNHDRVPAGDLTCWARNMQCCRFTCGGPGSYCYPKEKLCPIGYRRSNGLKKCENDGFSCCVPEELNVA